MPMRRPCIPQPHIVQSNVLSPIRLRVGVNLSPDLLYLLALDLRLLAVYRCSFEALGAETHVDCVLLLVAHADGLVEETARMALFEGGHDLLAGFVVLGVQVWMHVADVPFRSLERSAC